LKAAGVVLADDVQSDTVTATLAPDWVMTVGFDGPCTGDVTTSPVAAETEAKAGAGRLPACAVPVRTGLRASAERAAPADSRPRYRRRCARADMRGLPP
jgi:hypothetical protein